MRQPRRPSLSEERNVWQRKTLDQMRKQETLIAPPNVNNEIREVSNRQSEALPASTQQFQVDLHPHQRRHHLSIAQ